MFCSLSGKNELGMMIVHFASMCFRGMQNANLRSKYAEISCDKVLGKLQKVVLYVTQYQQQKYSSK